jgi:hypothetical protein
MKEEKKLEERKKERKKNIQRFTFFALPVENKKLK